MTPHETVYHEQIVMDYKDNPLIEALPPILSGDNVVDMLSRNEGQHDREQQLDSQYRLHCVQRLFRYFQPLEQHVDIEGRFSRCIRQGYLHRNPLCASYAGALAQGHMTLVSKQNHEALGAFRLTAAGFTIIGLSGVGKTTAVSNILAMYPQTISHTRYRESPLVLKQVVWLKLDCPHDGSVKGLCMSFFEAMDQAVDSNYFESCYKSRHTVDVLMIRMAQAARLHCLGVLVIDEIQHLNTAKGGGQEKMLNFFVTLVNTIGVPVVLIGTSRAMSVLQSEFRQARRGSGQGDLIWDRMKNDVSWDVFASSMWRNQWTRQAVPMMDAFKNTLYNESQGIIDIAVKLYAMVQVRAIALGKESFESTDFHIVANERTVLEQNKNVPQKRNEISLSEKAVLKLLELGVDPSKAKQLTGKAMISNQEARSVADVVRIAYRIFLSAPEPDKNSASQAGDLRNLAGYEDMKADGVVESEEW